MGRQSRYLSDKREAQFPNLRKDTYKVTSDEDWSYNCIAHAADKKDAPWWPAEDGAEGYFWPDDVAPREETVEAFVAAYRTQGYVPCNESQDGPGLIEGFEKVAIYVDSEGKPTHAAKQTLDGKWSSKLGDWEDIEHAALEDVGRREGGRPGYGEAKKFLIRTARRSTAAPSDAMPETDADQRDSDVTS